MNFVEMADDDHNLLRRKRVRFEDSGGLDDGNEGPVQQRTVLPIKHDSNGSTDAFTAEGARLASLKLWKSTNRTHPELLNWKATSPRWLALLTVLACMWRHFA